jgi:hypothetical protein
MKKFVVTLLVSLIFIASKTQAQTAIIKFPSGSAPATIKGHVNPLSSASYQLSVDARQRVALHLTSTSRKKLVQFTVKRNRSTGKPLPDAEGATDWEGTLAEGGDYWIDVYALPAAGEESFTLVISTPRDAQAVDNNGGGGASAEPSLNTEKVAARGASPQDFVPPGWKIAERVEGDLNGDGRMDQALQLVTADAPDDSSGTAAAPEAQALLVLLADGDALRRAGLATKLLTTLAPQYSVELTIKNGVLNVHQDYGMSDVVDLKHLFRYEPGTGRFLLIGRDVFTYTRPLSDDTVKTSENYLTGVRLTTTGHFRRGVVGPETSKREQFARKKIYLEDVDEDASQ